MTPENFYSALPQPVATQVQRYVRFLEGIGCKAYGLGNVHAESTLTGMNTGKTPNVEILVDARTFNKKAAVGFLPGTSVDEIAIEMNERLKESGAEILKQSTEGLTALKNIATRIYTLRNSNHPEHFPLQVQQATREYLKMFEIFVHSATETYEGMNDFERSPIPLLIQGTEALYLPPRKKVKRTRIRENVLEARIGNMTLNISFTNEEPFTVRPETLRVEL